MDIAVDDEYFANIEKEGLILCRLFSSKPESQFEIKYTVW